MGNGSIELIQTRVESFRGNNRGDKRAEPDWKARLAQRNEAKRKLIAKLKKQVRQV